MKYLQLGDIMINNPVAYYKEMGFTSIDSLVYTGSLIGALGGILGVVNGVRYSQMKQIAVFGVMTVACGFGLMEGLDIANKYYPKE
jgi:hypothetical protein